MKWYERIRFRGWYIEFFVKDKKRSWIGGAHWPVMLIEDQKNDGLYEQTEIDTIEHEKIHFKQQLELLLVGFWIMYGYYHLTRGYDLNPFEMEADFFEVEPDARKMFGWINFV